jgi:hypothetical protein
MCTGWIDPRDVGSDSGAGTLVAKSRKALSLSVIAEAPAFPGLQVGLAGI